MFDETTIFHARIWTHPIEIETTILKVDVSNSRTELYDMCSGLKLKFPKKIVFDENVFLSKMVFGLSGITNQIDQSGDEFCRREAPIQSYSEVDWILPT